ncbi:MAG: YcxB family protein [Ruminococcus sp.]|nr:YcxB family protein [Ruminococcus sp.]
MEENYRLEKEYTVSPEIFEKAYRSYQKKFVYLKSYIFMGIFLILAADFIYAAVKNPSNTLVYLLIVVCLALAFREWHNPRFVRRRLVETVRDMGKVVYKIGVGDGFIDISTVDDGSYGDEDEDEAEDSGGNAEEASAENADEDDEITDDIPPEAEELMPEKSRLNTKENYSLLEYDEYFLLIQGKEVFYILPKAGFSEDELEIIRKTSAECTE